MKKKINPIAQAIMENNEVENNEVENNGQSNKLKKEFQSKLLDIIS